MKTTPINTTVARWEAENRSADVKHHLGQAGWAAVRLLTPDKTLVAMPVAHAFDENGTAARLAKRMGQGLLLDATDVYTESKNVGRSLNEAWKAFSGGPRTY